MLLVRKYTLHQTVVRGEGTETRTEDIENQTVNRDEAENEDPEKEAVMEVAE